MQGSKVNKDLVKRKLETSVDWERQCGDSVGQESFESCCL